MKKRLLALALCCVLLCSGCTAMLERNYSSSAAHVDYYVQTGMTKKDAIKAVAVDRGVAKSEIYNEVMKK